MRIILSLCLIALAISQVYSHSVLTVPTPWNTNPSKTSPCGGGTAATTAVYTYCKGKPTTIEWKVIAADGRGPITVSLDTNGGTNFNTPVTVTGPTPNAETTFTFSMTVPDVTCANNKCTMQVKSDSNWFSCATINIAETCNTTKSDQLVTVLAEDLKFCGEYANNHRVMIPIGQTAAQIDNDVKAAFTANIANPLVFGDNGTACRTSYAKYVCQENFPLDPGSTSAEKKPINLNTYSDCVNMNTDCKTTNLHLGLYPCSRNAASSMVPSIILVAVSLIAAVFMF
ncbi:hypothetical protein SAMD00019534_030050 [Acytostelium subglobosum LB1]|uniref:hypothetical protein n=1 Tax=Acytostelium subglobosum LB1 TaxID=1410327 RepID=UPI0006451601|nr:hypothetical protein SAMD00019534_030050 [Acytostelium subglobosum LB1]GAM19830.1 hypothetical protein SAMD00019534_030050 [Acytostelium subglobosum LB1]|eukprot:XP_012756592.1 hypothetical protein SAMD00019534_030050 [Acytostelium subglobosum LB1]